MKQAIVTLLLFVLLLVSTDVWAQPKHSFAFRHTLYNYEAPLRDGSACFSDIYEKNNGQGVELAYYNRLLPNMFLVVPLKVGAVRFPTDGGDLTRRELVSNLDALIQHNFFRYGALVNPFVQAGVGSFFNVDQREFGVNFPLAIGLNVRLADNLYATAQTQHRFSTNDLDGWHHGVGLQFFFGGSQKPVAEPPKPLVFDRDGDGVPDAEDRCPDLPGPATTFGCPDRDGDGVADKDDRCPDQPGPAALGGCPDRDGDGVPDIDDLCPDQPGPAANRGCPEVTATDQEILANAVKNVQFSTGSATLLASSHAVLDQVATLLARYPERNLVISGHTDSVGDDKFNLDLSQRRAKACYDYLIGKGVSANRMSHAGYGETRPIASNDTEAGRTKNRRVEFELRLK